MKKIYAIGLMSGTSMDAIDACLVECSTKQEKSLFYLSKKYSPKLRHQLQKLIDQQHSSLSDYAKINNQVGLAFAAAANACLKKAQHKKLLPKNALVVIGSHGQTIFHEEKNYTSLQIGNPAIIAQKTGLTTVSDFRAADLAAKGTGAPFLPFYHRRLLKEAGSAIHNLGGISNFSYFGPKQKVVALDTGPASCLIDMAIYKLSKKQKNMDRNGAMAKKGIVHTESLNFLLAQKDVVSFRRKNYPKSTGRELFHRSLLDKFFSFSKKYKISKEDQIATLTMFSAQLMAEAYERFVLAKKLPLKKIYFAGGGAKNKTMLAMLQEKLPQVKLLQFQESFQISSDALEAHAFGYYAWRTLAGDCINLPTVTGAQKAAICGVINPANNWNSIQKIIQNLSTRLHAISE